MITWRSQPGDDSGAAIACERPVRLAELTHFPKASQPGNADWLTSCNGKIAL